jgi:hypothetical protein
MIWRFGGPLAADDWAHLDAVARDGGGWRPWQALQWGGLEDYAHQMAWLNHMLPDHHPAKITRERIESLRRSHGFDLAASEDLDAASKFIAALEAYFLPPTSIAAQ